ncbi:MAG: hypothetical protein PVH07_03935, partial [Chloroflexota bacterium]|jgi:hypothetical protein
MSLGLVLGVAGYAWPEDAGVAVRSELTVAPAAEQPALAPVEPDPEMQPPTGVAVPGAATVLPRAPEAGTAPPLLEFFADESMLEGLAEHQAGTSARSQAVEKAVEAELAEEADIDALTVGPDDAAGDAALGAAAAADSVPVTVESDIADRVGDAAEPANGENEGLTAANDTPVATEESGVEAWLVALGAALAIAGGLLLVLGWLARRSADPLLR